MPNVSIILPYKAKLREQRKEFSVQTGGAFIIEIYRSLQHRGSGLVPKFQTTLYDNGPRPRTKSRIYNLTKIFKFVSRNEFYYVNKPFKLNIIKMHTKSSNANIMFQQGHCSIPHKSLCCYHIFCVTLFEPPSI